jgi:hypothetical protein
MGRGSSPVPLRDKLALADSLGRMTFNYSTARCATWKGADGRPGVTVYDPVGGTLWAALRATAWEGRFVIGFPLGHHSENHSTWCC